MLNRRRRKPPVTLYDVLSLILDARIALTEYGRQRIDAEDYDGFSETDEVFKTLVAAYDKVAALKPR